MRRLNANWYNARADTVPDAADGLRIVFISNEFPPNVRAGLGRYAERIVRYFIQDGHHLWVFAANSGDLPERDGEPPLVIYRPVRWWMRRLLRSTTLNRWRAVEITLLTLNVLLYSIDTFFLVRRLLKHTPIDVIAVHDTTSGPIGGILLALTTRVPVVFHVHSTETTMTPWAIVKDPLHIIAALERLLARLATRIVVLSAEQVDFVAAHGWDTRKIAVVPHGYDTGILRGASEWTPAQRAQHTAALRSQLQIAPDQPVILFVGRLVAVKGVHTLIRTMPHLLEAIPHARLVLVGEGKGGGEDAKVAGLIRELGLERQVHAYHRFLDPHDVMVHMLAADICVFPSIYEPFGLVAVEAMALGRPVVLGPGFARMFAGPDPGCPTARFVEQDDPACLAAAIVDLLRDEALRAGMGIAAQTFVMESFRWERTVAETVRVYREAMREDEHRYANT
jgi:glycosyltransferase involved in cell wall biosynthesis